jgi:pimeloyl-ACP methyl ester carboxylesterase
VTSPIAHWPGRMVTLAAGERVYVAETPPSVQDDRAVLARGDDPPDPPAELLLCVHGMSGAATNWTDFMAELAPDFDAVAVDLPGSGFSPPPAAKRGYAITALASTVIRLIEALDAGPVHLAGNSMGGAVSIRVAAARPDLLRTLTLVSPVLPDLLIRPELLRFPLVGLPGIGEWLMRRSQLIPAENRVAGVLATCFHDPGAVHPERFMLDVAELKRRDELAYNATTLSRAARTIVAETLRPRKYSLWAAAERITVPTLVTFGSHDRLVNPRLAAPARRAFRDATVMVLPQTGHVAQMERPRLVAQLFREMVNESRARGAGGNSVHRDQVDA